MREGRRVGDRGVVTLRSIGALPDGPAARRRQKRLDQAFEVVNGLLVQS